jgi:hypothetical protein
LAETSDELSVRGLADTFHDRWLARNPFAASVYGIPGYEDRVPDDSEAGEAAARAELESVLADAGRFEQPQLRSIGSASRSSRRSRRARSS